MDNKITKSKYFIPVFFFLWVVFTQLFCNIDSYFFAQCGQNDSSWYFMCGKAWMNGMLPYCDFADSKGILLWFIYAMGYLIDHYSYVGVFWIMCVSIWTMLMISYHTAKLWFGRKESLIVVLLMTVVMFYWNFYIEAKSEVYSWPYVAFALYVLCRQLKDRQVKAWHFFLVGLSVSACLLLKWTIGIMMMSFVMSIAWLAMYKKNLCRMLLFTSFGILSMILPFACYFLLTGTFDDFIREYFCNTFATVSMSLGETLNEYGKEWIGMLTSRRIFYLLSVFFAVVVWRKDRPFASALPFLCGLFFVGLAIHRDMSHYLWVLVPFIFFPMAFVVRKVSCMGINVSYLLLAVVAGIGFDIWGTIRYTGEFCTKTSNFDKMMAVSYVMSKVENPKISVETNMGNGYALAHALPGSRYWTKQLGATEEMQQGHELYLYSGEPDFVILHPQANYEKVSTALTALGYHSLCETILGVVFTKHNLSMPSEIIHVSPWDIITKKTYMELYDNAK